MEIFSEIKRKIPDGAFCQPRLKFKVNGFPPPLAGEGAMMIPCEDHLVLTSEQALRKTSRTVFPKLAPGNLVHSLEVPQGLLF